MAADVVAEAESEAPKSRKQESRKQESREQDEKSSERARRWARVRSALKWSFLVAVFGSAGWMTQHELATSTLQARYLSEFAHEATFWVETGPSATVRFPTDGPHDERLGYTKLPEIAERLNASGFRLSEQARLSPRSLELVDEGLNLPYWPANKSGLSVTDKRGSVVHESLYPTRAFDSFDEIPRLIVDALLHIENRSLLDPARPTFNPALEWKRFGRAVAEVGFAEVGADVDPDGASTLATQIEKYRHSPGGMTGSYDEKLRQMMSASLRAYRDGEQTMRAQQNVVLTYVNSVPLSAVPGFGEVLGIGDGLYAWYGASFEGVSELLAEASAQETDASHPRAAEQARAFRQVLSLFVAQRRPSYFLADDAGRARLAEMTDFYLRDLARHGIISQGFRDLALDAEDGPFQDFVDNETEPFWARKHAHALRVDLLEETGAATLYALDRWDLSVETTVNQDVQHAVANTLQRLADPAFIAEQGLDDYRLLDKGDPAEVIYSFTLYERTPHANVLRVQADTYDQPFNINEGMKLNLGSTAKLRTTATYLMVVAELYDELSGMTAAELDALDVHWSDRLTHWVIAQLEDVPVEERSLGATLEAAMNRRYSASPTERFFTGGGIHRFSNFNYKYDHTSPTVRFALEKSINLVFVRMMREIVRYHMFRQEGVSQEVLTDRDDPRRKAYLERFADYEGTVFLGDFFRRYEELDARESLVRLFKSRRWSPKKFMTALRAVRPKMDIYTVHALLEEELDRKFSRDLVQEMYEAYGPERYDLNDQGYVSGVHPLELWLLHHKKDHPEASWAEVVEASRPVRQEVYEWLFATSRKHAQDQRIRVMMEQDAFEPIHREWKRLGYPFGELVPSYATSIGSSSDRPDALAELIGVILNDGLKLPEVRFTSLHFAKRTPYETRFERVPEPPQRVMPREVAETLRDALVGVVEDGTAGRLNDYPIEIDGELIEAGGKTGTGDNRHTVTNRHGRVVKSVARNRTATFVFFLGDRFFGTITAYVPGEQADEYHFTSGLAVSVLGMLGPALRPLWDGDATGPGVLAHSSGVQEEGNRKGR